MVATSARVSAEELECIPTGHCHVSVDRVTTETLEYCFALAHFLHLLSQNQILLFHSLILCGFVFC